VLGGGSVSIHRARRAILNDSGALQGHWHCRDIGIAGTLALQGHWHCRDIGIAGTWALQGHGHCRDMGIAGTLALQGHWHCRDIVHQDKGAWGQNFPVPGLEDWSCSCWLHRKRDVHMPLARKCAHASFLTPRDLGGDKAACAYSLQGNTHPCLPNTLSKNMNAHSNALAQPANTHIQTCVRTIAHLGNSSFACQFA